MPSLGATKTLVSAILPLCFCSVFVAHAYPALPPNGSDEAVVRGAIAKFTRAELRYDVTAVDRALDSSFVYVGNDGSLTSRGDFLRLTDKVQNPLEALEITDIKVA